MQINGYNIFDSSLDRIAFGKDSPIDCASADSNDPLRIWGGVVGTFQRLTHVFGDWSGDQKDVGMAGRCHKSQPKALEVVKRIAQRVDFQLTSIAGAGIDLPNCK